MIELRIEKAYNIIKTEGFNKNVKQVLLTGTYSLKAYRLFILLFNKVQKSYAFIHKDIGFRRFPAMVQYVLYYKSTQQRNKLTYLSDVTYCTFDNEGQIIIPIDYGYWTEYSLEFLTENLKKYFEFFFARQAHGETKDTMRNLHLLAQLYGFEPTEENHDGYIEIVGHPLNPFEGGCLQDLNEKFIDVQNKIHAVYHDYGNKFGYTSSEKIKTLLHFSDVSRKLHEEMEALLVK